MIDKLKPAPAYPHRKRLDNPTGDQVIIPKQYYRLREHRFGNIRSWRAPSEPPPPDPFEKERES